MPLTHMGYMYIDPFIQFEDLTAIQSKCIELNFHLYASIVYYLVNHIQMILTFRLALA